MIWREGEQDDEGWFGPWSVRWSVTETARAPVDDDALDLLAERMGIDPEFRDVRGRMVHTSNETKRALLAAMGHDGANAAAALEQMDRAEWLTPLPPVQVAREGAPLEVELVLPAGTTTDVAWRLDMEGGGQRCRHVAFGALEWIAARDLDTQRMERRRLIVGCRYSPRLSSPDHRPRQTRQPLSSSLLGDAGCRIEETSGCGASPRSFTCFGRGTTGALAISPICAELVELAAIARRRGDRSQSIACDVSRQSGHASPYSPASRLLLNVLNIDVTAVPELRDHGRSC